MLQRSFLLLVCVTLCLSLNATLLLAQKPLAIQHATIVTGTGETIEDGTIVFRDGKIVAVGADVDVPVAAQVIDGTGKYVMPGIIEAHTAEGLSQSNETNQNVPYVTVIDGIDPMDSYFRQARRNGVTSVRISPGNSTMIGGQVAVIKTGGSFVEDMVLDRVAGVKISMQPVSGSRMAHLAKLRKALSDARKKLEENGDDAADEDDADKADEEGDDEDSEDKSEEEKSDDDDKQEADGSDVESELDKAMNALLSGKYSAVIYCEKAMDVGQALRLIDEFDLRASLVLGRDCYKAVDQVAASKLPVILDSELVFWEEDPRTQEETKVELPRIFRDAGVEFVFQKERPRSSTVGTNYLWYQAATAVKYGMPEKDALAALTLVPARFLGLEDVIGSIEVGKDADVVILSGKPLRIDTWVEKTIVNGEVVYEKESDEQLQRLLSGEEDTE